MSLLFPYFLWGLFAISIPIIIHLFHFRRYKTVFFSNTVFLQNLEKQNRTKTKLKQYLILLARILLIVSLVLAFCQPFIPVHQGKTNTNKTYTAIYIDNSFSMDGESEKGKMIDAARQLAYDIVSAYPSDMQFLLTTNDFSPDHQRLLNGNDAKQQIADVKTTSLFRSLPEVLIRFSSLVKPEELLNIYIISDMQASNFETDIKIPEFKHNVVLIPISSNKQGNISIDSCWFATPVKAFGKTDEITVQIRNHSNQPYIDIPVKLIINDTVKTIASLNIEAGETKNIPLAFTHTSSGNVNGVIRIDDYPVTFDNSLYFSFSINPIVSILAINEIQNNRYLSALYSTEKTNFLYNEVKAGYEKTSEFAQYQVIIANGLKSIPSGMAASFKEYIESGHTLVLLPGEQCDIGSYNSLLNDLGMGSIGEIVVQKRKIAEINYKNYLFKDVFGKIETNIDLPEINSFYPLKLLSNSTSEIALSDEKSNALVVTNPAGAGKLVFCSVPLSNSNESFMKHPLFVPLFYNMALYSGSSQSVYFITGRESFFDISGFSPEQNTVLHIVDSVSDFIPNYRVIPGGARITVPNALLRAGHYNIESENMTHASISMNYSREESVTESLNNEEILAKLKEAGVKNVSTVDYKSDSFQSNVLEQSIGIMLWKYFVILALLFIIVEIAIIRLMK